MALSKITADSITANVITTSLIATSTITGDKIAAATIGSSNLTSTGVSSGSYGGTGNTVSITVDSQGRITAAANVAANAGSSQWTTTGSDIYYNTGKVGIGTIAPASKFVVANGSVQALEFNPTGGTAGGAYIQGYNRTSFVYIPVEIIASSFAVYPQGGGQKVQVNFNGLGLGGAAPSSGIGITFPATQDPSSDANTLDDYEEGTWTPTLGGNTTYSGRSGNYVKIGRVVYIDFYIEVNIIGTGSSTLMTGAPFTCSNPSTASGSTTYQANLATSVVSIGANFTNGTNIRFDSRTAASVTAQQNATFGNSTALYGCMTYLTST